MLNKIYRRLQTRWQRRAFILAVSPLGLVVFILTGAFDAVVDLWDELAEEWRKA